MITVWHFHMALSNQAVWNLNNRFAIPENEKTYYRRDITLSSLMVLSHPRQMTIMMCWYGGRYDCTPVGWMQHKVRLLCSIDLTLLMNPHSPFLLWYHQDYNPLHTSIPIPKAPPTMCHVYFDWVGGYLLHELPMEITGAKSHLPFIPPLFPLHLPLPLLGR